MAPTVKETDPLDHLEERIQKAVALVGRLRQEKDAAAQDKDAVARALELERVEASKALAEAVAAERNAAADALALERRNAAEEAAFEREASAETLANAIELERKAAAEALAAERSAATEALEASVQAATSEREAAAKVADALRVDLEEARNANTRLAADLEAMRQERQVVRARLEKLLGHIDQLGAA